MPQYEIVGGSHDGTTIPIGEPEMPELRLPSKTRPNIFELYLLAHGKYRCVGYGHSSPSVPDPSKHVPPPGLFEAYEKVFQALKPFDGSPYLRGIVMEIGKWELRRSDKDVG